ncbi:hypothetical protein E6W39_34640 [Kitasatospora acidiphila]|uniref:Transposase n=1 Tax=Kitasatospora acidiphila TaxID=2567942 RepID=A0A540WBJ4_9ACTN|nr:hypothetical protein E6W39_34640 [Kitasatospora acidiphila]
MSRSTRYFEEKSCWPRAFEALVAEPAKRGVGTPLYRRWLRSRGITPRIARRGIESSERLGRHRWTVERTVAWRAGCRRLQSHLIWVGRLRS